ncbi:formin-binding protein 4-like protein isoform X1 [Cinnamomum micranthum f. kanehirae]|uniref:Formin-binding protein 4-like protein isoform X1 n=1 Tax=Cinnamomum micranthum f. kanehirae TaxID=337451 RepID=A0A3S3N9I4_9MAGN|nr:formin-binding protein 4-like protein isoform X1 [Cinnamomum micranthum f. kanehirae]
MGKRRDRRIAAQMAAGRRVKLDLFTEPSGDLVGASRHDEVGGDLDQDSHARAPNSPSSPGQQQENPLLLLGQYSDDELEEEEKKEPKPSAEESSSVHQKEVEEPVDIERDKESNGGLDVASPGVKQDDTDGDLDPLNAVKYMDNNDIGSIDSTALKPFGEVDSMAEVSSSGNSGPQIDQDATGEWKIVMHEESSGYYYWNTVTGETSWEAPDMLAQRMEAPGEKKLSPIIEESGSVLLDAHASSSDLIADLEVHGNASLFDRPRNANLIPNVKEHCESGFEMETGNVGTKDENIQVLNDNCSAISVSYMEASALIDSVSNQQSDMVNSGIEGSTSRSMELPMAVNVEEKNDHPIVSKEYAEASHVHSVRLITLGENLLQKLKVLEGSGEQTQALDRRVKYISEIEVRLSDCKALASYGSSLLPFWWHTETQLKQLELAIGKEAVPQSARHELLDKVETFHISSRDDDASQQTMGTASGVGGKDKGLLSTIENACASTDTANASESVHNQVDHLVHNEDDKPKYGLSSGFLGSEPGEIAPRANENLVPVFLDHKTESHAVDAADMDVDMEVDNETSEYHDVPVDASCNAQLEQPVHSNTTLPSLDATTSDPVEKFSAPPPPDEEWIPPPPPDNEPIPPPPPDEPPTPLFPLPPPYAESTPALPYVEQYSFAYTVPSYEYYAPAVTEVNNSTYYAPTESCQNVEPQPLPYYESAANVFPEPTPPVVTPVTSVVYYDLPNGAVPSEPVINSLESSSFYSESGSVSYHDNVASDYTGSIGVAPESGYAQIPGLKVQSDFYTSSSETDVVTVKGSSISTASYTPEAAVVNESAADPLPTADAKNPPKVVRNKKRTIAAAPTLRSNRKVSSLVDKWKAAKEELHGDKEDEPEDPYERLEKKRQKQIEEWRAQQIASGEARDNANFQPLGGDWRERVKRKRSESSSKSVQNPSREEVNEQQHPNLIELSKDLPSGWQAYWDESSKQVYYGNAVTSETSWTRPTN